MLSSFVHSDPFALRPKLPGGDVNHPYDRFAFQHLRLPTCRVTVVGDRYLLALDFVPYDWTMQLWFINRGKIVIANALISDHNSVFAYRTFVYQLQYRVKK